MSTRLVPMPMEDQVRELRAQLAAAKENNRESEEQHAHDCDQFNRLAQEKADAEKERDEYKSAWVYAVKQFAEATMRRGAQLAAVEKERDDMKRELDAAVNHVEFGLLPQREQLRVELAAANERVKALEAALYTMQISLQFATNDAVRSAAGRVYCSKCHDAVMAGLTKEGT